MKMMMCRSVSELQMPVKSSKVKKQFEDSEWGALFLSLNSASVGHMNSYGVGRFNVWSSYTWPSFFAVIVDSFT